MKTSTTSEGNNSAYHFHRFSTEGKYKYFCGAFDVRATVSTKHKAGFNTSDRCCFSILGLT